MAAATVTASWLDLWDWRSAVAEMYGAVRRARDAQAASDRWRVARDALFASHPQSPIEPQLRKAFRTMRYFPYDPALRFETPLARLLDGPEEAFDAGTDGDVRIVPFARTVGLAAPLGRELTLYWILGYGGGVFLPFADATSGTETYGGGRYLLDTIKGADLGRAATADGAVAAVLDFNFAYAPSCAYSDRYVCPLAPRDNRLPRAVRAGEIGPEYDED